MRALARTAGASWRGFLWLSFPPLGWYRSKRARERRRHRETIAAIRDQRRR